MLTRSLLAAFAALTLAFFAAPLPAQAEEAPVIEQTSCVGVSFIPNSAKMISPFKQPLPYGIGCANGVTTIIMSSCRCADDPPPPPTPLVALTTVKVGGKDYEGVIAPCESARKGDPEAPQCLYGEGVLIHLPK